MTYPNRNEAKMRCQRDDLCSLHLNFLSTFQEIQEVKRNIISSILSEEFAQEDRVRAYEWIEDMMQGLNEIDKVLKLKP